MPIGSIYVAPQINQPSSKKIQLELEQQALQQKQAMGIAATAAPKHLEIVDIGLGPRTAYQIMTFIDFIYEHRTDIEKVRDLGGNYDVRFNIYDRFDDDHITKGNAWGTAHEGTINTGVESFGKSEDSMLDYIVKNKTYFERKYESAPVILSGLQRSFAEGDISTGVPTSRHLGISRGDMGIELKERFERKVKFASENMPYLQFNINTESEVVELSIADPKKPVVTVQSNGREIKVPADLVMVNTGTPVDSPISDPGVLAHSYVGPMNHRDITAKMHELELLDESGAPKPDTKFLSGGSGLSQYDQLLQLDKIYHFFKSDSSSLVGYSVTSEAIEKYGRKDSNEQAMIMFVSNTPGKWIPPRHIYTPVWTQDIDGITDAKEQHALFLHKDGEQTYKSLSDMQVASVAAATGKTPDEVLHAGLDTKQILAKYHEYTQQHVEAKNNREDRYAPDKTLPGAMRQSALTGILGIVLSRNPQATIQELSEFAPLTYKGRDGYVSHNAQKSAVTNPNAKISRDNVSAINEFGLHMAYITASPYQVQAMAHMLIEAGIADYASGSYSDIKASSDEGGKPLEFTTKDGFKTKYDMCIVSPTFNLRKDSIASSLAGQVKPVHEELPNIPKLYGRRPISQADSSLANVEMYGLTNKGGRVKAIDGKFSYLGSYATDVNNRESAAFVAAGVAYRQGAAAHLAAAGYENAYDIVEKMYENLHPAEAEYSDEVEKFTNAFYNAVEKTAFLRAAKIIAGDNAGSYKELFEMARTYEGRLKMQPKLVNYPEAKQQVLHTRKEMGKFLPASMANFFERYIDHPNLDNLTVYKQALVIATKELESRSKKTEAEYAPDTKEIDLNQ